MSECRYGPEDWQLFTGCILLLSSSSRSALNDIDIFLQLGSYDFHQMRQLNQLRRRLAAYASIAEHYRVATDTGGQQR